MEDKTGGFYVKQRGDWIGVGQNGGDDNVMGEEEERGDFIWVHFRNKGLNFVQFAVRVNFYSYFIYLFYFYFYFYYFTKS